jgi:integral membrane sensor domain MASE1
MNRITAFILFIVIVVIPAWYLNKWMLKVTRPKQSFKRLLFYILLSVVVALAYSAVFILIITSIYPLPKK